MRHLNSTRSRSQVLFPALDFAFSSVFSSDTAYGSKSRARTGTDIEIETGINIENGIGIRIKSRIGIEITGPPPSGIRRRDRNRN
ncbi:hypothetical protein EVAR_2588_1 [Eumeta japonica]|uniref:Uncharacterized protein n=1 Tax=Eumeta variegata TaxID=151549 RepID=A0A4C1SLT7_EUMVA|nr:hypothetical protein EVAR_2588_1 [Eumeta japonica]